MASPQLCLQIWHLLLKLSWFLQTQELIFSFLSIFVLLNINLHLAYIPLLILVDLLFPLTSFLFLILKSASTPHSETRCLKSPSVLTFIILLKYSSFPYWFPHSIGALLSLPHTLSWNSHLQKVGTFEFGQETVLNILKCYYKKQTRDARGVESPNILWILRVWEVRKE